jgi:hypothetical protein
MIDPITKNNKNPNPAIYNFAHIMKLTTRIDVAKFQ